MMIQVVRGTRERYQYHPEGAIWIKSSRKQGREWVTWVQTPPTRTMTNSTQPSSIPNLFHRVLLTSCAIQATLRILIGHIQQEKLWVPLHGGSEPTSRLHVKKSISIHCFQFWLKPERLGYTQRIEPYQSQEKTLTLENQRYSVGNHSVNDEGEIHQHFSTLPSLVWPELMGKNESC
jgi:hypothetical protein